MKEDRGFRSIRKIFIPAKRRVLAERNHEHLVVDARQFLRKEVYDYG